MDPASLAARPSWSTMLTRLGWNDQLRQDGPNGRRMEQHGRTQTRSSQVTWASTRSTRIDFTAHFGLDPIETAIDVRTTPFSAYVSHFDRPSLEHALGEEGVEYVFMGAVLGARPEDPTCYSYGADGKKRVPDYRIIANKEWFREGTKTVIGIGRCKKAALLCSEEDPGRCHRHHLVARSSDADIAHLDPCLHIGLLRSPKSCPKRRESRIP